MLKRIWNNRWFAQIFRTKIGLAGVSFVWMCSWLAVANNTYAAWPFWVAMLGCAYLVGLTLVMMAYAWVINPLRDYRERNAKK